MKAPSPAAIALKHSLFGSLSTERQEQLDREAQLRKFQLGEPLCSSGLIPNEILLILSGTARLLTRDQGRLVSLGKLEAGSLVGLASLLRASPCETVSASTDVVALAVPDSLIIGWLVNDHDFQLWCTTKLFPAELAELAAFLRNQIATESVGIAQALQVLAKNAVPINPSNEDVARARAAGLNVLVASANSTNLPLYSQLMDGTELPPARPPLPLRLIGVPENLNIHLSSNVSPVSQVTQEPVTNQGISRIHSQRSSLDLGQDSQITSFRLVRGKGVLAETLATLRMVAQVMDLPFRRDALEKIVTDALQRGKQPNPQLFGTITAGMGLHVHASLVPRDYCTRLQTPCLFQWQDSLVLLLKADASGLMLASPRDGAITISYKELSDRLPEKIEVLSLNRSATTPIQHFNFSWFWPVIRQHRRALFQVLITSFVIQLFTLANPLLIQVIIDKVITQRSLDTLQVLGIALLTVTVLSSVLTSLRTFLFTETTNRIDTRLGAEIIDHLLRLPLGYFDRRPVGDLGTRLSELEKIRNFLTGQALTSIVDALFSCVYIVVMATYSWILTIVALIVIPVQVAITFVGAPLFRRQFRQTAEANAATQSHLVEVLTGIQTVKAQNVELISRWKWQQLYSKYIGQTFQKTITGTILNQSSQILQQISQLMVLWIGASLVLDGQLTLGQLIAFRIIGSYVTQPILRLSGIWQNVQELRVSFERLADVVDTPEESDEADQAKIPLPPLIGTVAFKDVYFRFPDARNNILSGINLEVPAGKFIGVVGPSGSGKSTLMKLVSRLYTPQKGRIFIDGYDINKVELYSLRRQIGIVPQTPLLFAGTISENIALTNPEATSESIVSAAKVACAHDFIMDLPEGYSTQLGERGTGLSGGQQQRLALARTLLANPQLLVLDEATSALDYDTEQRVCRNLHNELAGRTVFFVTHRLPTIRNADLIVLVDRGVIIEQGTHDQLMEQRGAYFALYRQQDQG